MEVHLFSVIRALIWELLNASFAAFISRPTNSRINAPSGFSCKISLRYNKITKTLSTTSIAGVLWGKDYALALADITCKELEISYISWCSVTSKKSSAFQFSASALKPFRSCLNSALSDPLSSKIADSLHFSE